jgi:radical SAM superfamily enzyme YgiQ (UPF0313 family)
MAHSLLAQIAQELPNTFVDLAFLPKPNDYDLLTENGFPAWFGTNTKLAPDKFDLICITNPISMEQVNYIPLLHDSGLPIFKDQRMERKDIPLIIMGGMNSATMAPLCGAWTDPEGNVHEHLIDGVVIGDGEVTLKQLIAAVQLAKATGMTKKQVLRSLHGKIHGFYEPDCYVHDYDGRSRITAIKHARGREYAALPVRGAIVPRLDLVRTLETKILPFNGDGASVDVAIAGSRGCHRAGTLIATERGRIPIEQVRPGDRVATNSGTRTVQKLWRNGPQQFYRLRSKWGFEIESTADHEFLTATKEAACVRRRFRKGEYGHLECLPKDTYLVVQEGLSALTEPALNVELRNVVEVRAVNSGWTSRNGGAAAPRKEIQAPTHLSTDLAEILGYLEGDGTITVDGVQFLYAWHERELQETYDQGMLALFGLRPGASWDTQRGTSYTVPYHSRQLLEFFESLGLKSGRLPECVRLGTAASKAAYLRGLFTADGTCGGKQATIALSSVNRTLLREVQQILLDLGIFSSLELSQKEHLKRGTDYLCKDLWRVSVRGPQSWKRFKELVGFSLKAKQKILESYPKREDGDYGRFQDNWVADQLLSVEKTDVAEAFDLKVEGEHSYTANGFMVHNCIGGPGGDCSFCREGNEAPYRERSLPKVLDALEKATANQGTKEVSFFSLNFNQYSDFFPLVLESVKRGYQVGLISQRIDMLAETPEQVRVQRWLSKSNFTLGVEGISERLRSFLAKNTTEEQILTTIQLMMEEGAGELKLFYIVTGMEDAGDNEEFVAFMEKVEALKKAGSYSTRFRISFTPLFPSANTPLQFYPCFAASKHGSRSLDTIFKRAKELGWGRRLSVSGEEPLVSNTINHGGRNIFSLLLASHFQDGFRFYGNIPKGTWVRWKNRIDQDPNIDINVIWGEKNLDYIFPWDDVRMGMPKETLHEEYLNCTAFKGSHGYCLTTRLKKGKCLWTKCGLCSLGTDDRKPNQEVVQAIINRKVAPPIPMRMIEEVAKSREKAYHLRVNFRTTDPIYRFVDKGYFRNAIPRALMKASPRFNDAFIKSLGHARIAAGANTARDWTFGHNIYDFSLSDHLPESELKALIPAANALLGQGEIVDLRMDQHLTILRKDVDFAIYSTFIPNSGVPYGRLRNDIERYFERKYLGREAKIRIKKAQGKGVFVTIEKNLSEEEVRQVSYQWMPEHRGTLVRTVTAGNYNVLAMFEALTQRKSFHFKAFPTYCHGYVQLAEETGETDLFAALSGEAQRCRKTGLPLERDLFTGEKMKSGICLAAEDGLDINFPVNMDWFFTRQLEAVEIEREIAA